jgi:hypothetical protein
MRLTLNELEQIIARASFLKERLTGHTQFIEVTIKKKGLISGKERLEAAEEKRLSSSVCMLRASRSKKQRKFVLR